MFFLNRILAFYARSVLRAQCISVVQVPETPTLQQRSQKEDIATYLRDHFQVPKKSARLLSKVCGMSDIDDRVQYFKSLGLSTENIGLVFKKFSRTIMTMEVTEMDKRVEFLSVYTTQFRDPNVLISHLIPQYPLLLFHPVDAMAKRIQLLKKCNLNEQEIAKVVRYNPIILLTKLEDTFDDLVKYLKDRGLSDDIIHKFLTKHPRSITYRWEAIEKRVRFFMDELGYTRDRIIEVFTNNPMVMTSNVERMRERSNFIKNEMGLTNQSLIRSPLVLRYSLERIQWRYHYLSHIGYVITDDTYLLSILYVTDELFAKYIAKQPVDNILAFKAEFYKNRNAVHSNAVSNTTPEL